MTAVRVHAEVTGARDAPPLVLINSLGTDLTMWDPQVPVLAEQRRVIRYDTRGHGRSPAPPGPYTIDDLGSDLITLLDRLAIARAAVCGISLGGMTALWLARHHPDRVERLVLADTAARIGTRDSWRERADTVRRHGTASVADTVIDRFLSPDFRASEPRTAERLHGLLSGIDDEGYASCCLALAEADLRDEIAGIAAPALVIAGSEDVATPMDDVRWLDAHLADSRLIVLHGAGHLSSIEQPAAFTEAVRGFLEETT